MANFFFSVARDPEVVERYRCDAAGTVAWWEADKANQILNCVAGEASTWLSFTEEERDALSAHDHVAPFRLGAHPFLSLTLRIAMFLRHDHAAPVGLRHDVALRPPHFLLPPHVITT